jgi:hypothetical protein
MSGTGENPLPGFPAIGQYELVPEPGEPGYEEPETVEDPGDEPLEAEVSDLAFEPEEAEPIDPESDDPYGYGDDENDPYGYGTGQE